MSAPKKPIPPVLQQPGRANVRKIKGLQVGPTRPAPGSMLKQPKKAKP
jgi:hypothetical protein